MNMWRIRSFASSLARKLKPRKQIDALITVSINGTDILGPLSGESLGIIAKYAGVSKNEYELAQILTAGDVVNINIKYIER